MFDYETFMTDGDKTYQLIKLYYNEFFRSKPLIDQASSIRGLPK